MVILLFLSCSSRNMLVLVLPTPKRKPDLKLESLLVWLVGWFNDSFRRCAFDTPSMEVHEAEYILDT